MTAEIGKSIQKLRALSPRFNAAAEDAGKIIKLVEEFLTDECRAGITTDVPVWRAGQPDFHADRDDFEGMYLGYRRVGGKYRITIQNNEKSWDDDQQQDVVTPVITPWTDTSRADKLESFPKLPDLLEQIAAQMERGITSAADTSLTVQSVVASLANRAATSTAVGDLAIDGGPRFRLVAKEPEIQIVGFPSEKIGSGLDLKAIGEAVNGTTEQQLQEAARELMRAVSTPTLRIEDPRPPRGSKTK